MKQKINKTMKMVRTYMMNPFKKERKSERVKINEQNKGKW